MAQITTLIEEQIGKHIANPQVLTKQLISGKIQGKFKSATRVYNYILTKKDLTYSPAGNMDSALFSALYLQRFDAVAKRPKIGKSNCTYKSYQCGKICLGLRRRCRKSVNDVERVAKIFYMMEQDERTGKTVYNKAIGEVAEGDRGKVIARAQKMRNSEERGAKARELLEQRRGKQKEGKTLGTDQAKKIKKAFVDIKGGQVKKKTKPSIYDVARQLKEEYGVPITDVKKGDWVVTKHGELTKAVSTKALSNGSIKISVNGGSDIVEQPSEKVVKIGSEQVFLKVRKLLNDAKPKPPKQRDGVSVYIDKPSQYESEVVNLFAKHPHVNRLYETSNSNGTYLSQRKPRAGRFFVVNRSEFKKMLEKELSDARELDDSRGSSTLAKMKEQI